MRSKKDFVNKALKKKNFSEVINYVSNLYPKKNYLYVIKIFLLMRNLI